jgi:hypothetical protein
MHWLHIKIKGGITMALAFLTKIFSFISSIFSKVKEVVADPKTQEELKIAVMATTQILETTPQGMAAKPVVLLATQEIINTIDNGSTGTVAGIVASEMSSIKVEPQYAVFVPIIQQVVAEEVEKLLNKYFSNAKIADLKSQLQVLRTVCVWINNGSGGTAK